MKYLVEIEGPESVEPAPGEPQLIAEVQMFILRWIQQSSRFRMVVRPVVTVQRLDFDVVPVKAEALLRLQSKCSVLDWVLGDMDAILAIMNHSKPPPDVAYKLGAITVDAMKARKASQ